MLLAFIPARGGSKGIPSKNLVLLNGKPLIQYTIEAALASQSVDAILLSTDDENIAETAQRLGVACAYRRPAELAADTTAMIDTVEHGLLWFERTMGVMPDQILLLQPTSPLRIASDINAAVKLFRSEGADTLVSVHRMVEHPCECVVTTQAGWEYLSPPSEGTVRRQDYKNNYFFINGAIYLARTATLLRDRKFVCEGKSVLYVMPRERGVDIDTRLDLTIAEALSQQSRQANSGQLPSPQP